MGSWGSTVELHPQDTWFPEILQLNGVTSHGGMVMEWGVLVDYLRMPRARTKPDADAIQEPIKWVIKAGSDASSPRIEIV